MTSLVLDRPTLVLNRNWQPVAVATVARTLTRVWNGKARIVDPVDYRLYEWEEWSDLVPADGELAIQTGRLRLRVPEVVTLNRYDRVPVNGVSFSRRNIFKRDQHTCQYCGQRLFAGELTIDHVLPRSKGGVSSWENCVLACVECNTKKADRSPQQAHMRLIKQPVRPVWKPLYANYGTRIDSWSHFVSDAYWNVELED